MSVDIRLSWAQVQWVAVAGVQRRVYAAANDLPELDGVKSHHWESHIVGCLGEYAVSLFLDCAWDPRAGLIDRSQGDLGQIEVKTTPWCPTPSRPDLGVLPIRADAPDDRAFFLVYDRMPTFRVVGSIRAGVAKQRQDWYRELAVGRPKVYCVPPAELEPAVPSAVPSTLTA